MAGMRYSLDRVGYDLLAHALHRCGREEFSGQLRVAGVPGGTFHLRAGLVVGAESPGAPGPETLLLRSGRVSGEQWAEVVRESGGARWPATGLIARGHAGAAQLRVVCVMALHDAAFAIVAGRVHGCERVAGAEPFATVAVGETCVRLLQDATRRLAALATLPHPLRPDRERPTPVPGVDPGPLSPLQRALLDQADGRSTARDLAFRTGRGVYTVTVEMARMLADGLLECPEAPVPIPVRPPPDGQGVRQRKPAPAASRAAAPPVSAVPPAAPDELPRRRPGASGIAEALAPERTGASWKGFFRLRNGAPK
ncbi:MarR family transcriptional regulator [Streptomyces justiciae]|uniref:MarR family transcriptional regulator n=1 Tax=Streptomyces justiciae TaxID=2780140 RepID=A0ABU3LQ98_9ACTN|nr:MarR family transcriptional regulator [Streptomyces justiciae]MDT7841001.1 MarR family transcriptional regulator [Streptomyces justiciae]